MLYNTPTLTGIVQNNYAVVAVYWYLNRFDMLICIFLCNKKLFLQKTTHFVGLQKPKTCFSGIGKNEVWLTHTFKRDQLTS